MFRTYQLRPIVQTYYSKRARDIRKPRARRTAHGSKKASSRRCRRAPHHPDAKIEIWAADEHRIGLKPITRGVWAPIGERPIALGHHRFEWLYVTGFVEPATGSTVWNVSNKISKAYLELVLADFAKSVGAGKKKRIVLQIDNAGWRQAGIRAEGRRAPPVRRLVHLERRYIPHSEK